MAQCSGTQVLEPGSRATNKGRLFQAAFVLDATPMTRSVARSSLPVGPWGADASFRAAIFRRPARVLRIFNRRPPDPVPTSSLEKL